MVKSSSHQSLIDEDKEIRERLHKLRESIDSSQFQLLDSVDKKMLKIQAHIMEKYDYLLVDRILYIEGKLDNWSIDEIKSIKIIDK